MTITSSYRCALIAFLTMAISLVSAASSARGVIISTGDGTGNTTNPGDDPGWDNVGLRGGGTGVYLGDRWVLTANHVGAGSIVLDGTTYLFDGSTSIQLQNPTGMGLTTNTDLRLFRITVDPGLPTVAISATAPSVGSSLVMIGNGRDRAAATTTWNASWVEGGTPVAHTGYKWLGTRAMRWGQNSTLANGFEATVGGLDVLTLVTTFSSDGTALTHEAQGAEGDSGGAVFYKNGSQWELSGIMVAIANHVSGQPGSTAVFGNFTVSADLSEYREQIYDITGIPEPASGSLLIFSFAAVALVRRKRAR